VPEYRRSRAEGATYFFTVVTYRRQSILCLAKSLEALRDVFKNTAERRPFQVDAWVVLPDHLHFIWSLPEGDSDYSTRWAIIKKELTKRLRTLVDADVVSTRSRVRHREGLVWQRRFWEHQIRDERDYRAHVDYIHFNPVKHGCVRTPKDWPFSSFPEWVARGAYKESWGGDGSVELPDDIGQE